MKRTNLLLLSLCALGLIFTRCDFNWNFSRKYTIAIKQPDQAYIQSAELDSIWKSSYEYAVLIPEDTTISTYFHLIEALPYKGYGKHERAGSGLCFIYIRFHS